MNLVRTYLKRLPTLREPQTASFFLGWPRQSQQNLPTRKPKSECPGASQPTSAGNLGHTLRSCHKPKSANHQLITSGERKVKGFLLVEKIRDPLAQWTLSLKRLNHKAVTFAENHHAYL